MQKNLGVKIFALIEILIGAITWIAVIWSLFLGTSAKPWAVLLFVLTSAFISMVIGIGLLRCNRASYRLLLYFSSVIILSKILIFAKVISLHGALETTIPAPIKNSVSILYHSALILYFLRPSVRKWFEKR